MTEYKTRTNWEHILVPLRQIYELCQTILEAAVHAASSHAAAQMEPVIREGIYSATKAACGLWIEQQSDLIQMEKSFLNTLPCTDGSLLKRHTEDWFRGFGNTLLKLFTDQLHQEVQISSQQAKEMELLVSEHFPMKPDGKSQLLLDIALRCGLSAPELSFRLILKAFLLFPQLAQGQWKDYVYKPDAHSQTEFENCPICGGSRGLPYLSAYSCRISSFDPMFLPAKLWMKCPDCGNLYTRYFPSEFLKLGASPVAVEPQKDKMQMRAANQQILHLWGKILNQIRTYTTGTDLLEVGVGEGYLIAAAREMGYTVTAVELLSSCARETADLLECPIICGDFLHLPEEHTYSILTMGDVLEHLRDPRAGLEKAHRLLKKDRILWLSTPNYESAYAQMTKVSDVMWCEPFHITYFSRAGLYQLLDDVGFEVLEYIISSRYIDSMELIIKKK